MDDDTKKLLQFCLNILSIVTVVAGLALLVAIKKGVEIGFGIDDTTGVQCLILSFMYSYQDKQRIWTVTMSLILALLGLVLLLI